MIARSSGESRDRAVLGPRDHLPGQCSDTGDSANDAQDQTRDCHAAILPVAVLIGALLRLIARHDLLGTSEPRRPKVMPQATARQLGEPSALSLARPSCWSPPLKNLWYLLMYSPSSASLHHYALPRRRLNARICRDEVRHNISSAVVSPAQ